MSRAEKVKKHPVQFAPGQHQSEPLPPASIPPILLTVSQPRNADKAFYSILYNFHIGYLHDINFFGCNDIGEIRHKSYICGRCLFPLYAVNFSTFTYNVYIFYITASCFFLFDSLFCLDFMLLFRSFMRFAHKILSFYHKIQNYHMLPFCIFYRTYATVCFSVNLTFILIFRAIYSIMPICIRCNKFTHFPLKYVIFLRIMDSNRSIQNG